MIERTDYGMAVSCDTCSTEIELQTRDFDHAIETIKHRGWKIDRDPEGAWRHRCPVCVEDQNVNHRLL